MLPSAGQLERWHTRLLADDQRLAYLRDERGLAGDLIRDHNIGWDGRAYTLPVHADDDWGSLANVRRYVPGEGMRNRKGCGSPPRIYPVPPTPGHRHILVTEGEWDALVARSHGFDAYTSTGGAKRWPDESSPHFAGHVVYVAYDCDDAGRDGALRTARSLYPHARAVRIVDLHLDAGEDVTDWFVTHGRTVEELWSLLRAADQYEPQGDEEQGSADTDVDKELRRLRIRDQAHELLRQEKAAASWQMPPSRPTLTEELAIVDPPMAWTIGDLHPTGTNTLLSARFKAGKTTLLLNLLDALLTGGLFLNYFPTERPTGRVAFWNYELTERQFRGWLRAFDLPQAAQKRASVLHLRGHTLPLSSDYALGQAVDWLVSHDVSALIIDPFARAFDGDNENDNTQVGRFLERLDVMKQRAGVADLFLATHFGRGQDGSAERARGATRLDDWADVRWLYVVDENEGRFLKANGRDVDVPESEVLHDSATRKLSWIGGSRREAKEQGHIRSVVEAVAAEPGINASALRDAVLGHKQERPRYIAAAVRRGYVRVEKQGKANVHHVTEDGESLLSGRVKTPS